MPISKEAFARYVREALGSLHDPIHLQSNALAGLLDLRPAPGETAAVALRQLLRETIECLQPSESLPATRSEWLGYRLLWLRYVQSRSRYDICDELGLSRTSFYRHHQQALEAVVSLLWDRYQREQSEAASAQGTAVTPSPGEQALAEARKLAQRARPQMLDLGNVVEATLRMAFPLADRQGVALRTQLPESLPMTYGDPAIVRQIFLNVLTEGLKLAAPDGLELAVRVEDEVTAWQLRGVQGDRVTGQDIDRFPGLALCRALLGVCGGRLWLECEAGGHALIAFALPTVRPKDVLIIDDDDDTMALYERFLRTDGYQVHLARGSAQVQALLAQSAPDVVLLDVLMPGEDGWQILQCLKTMPETASIPVVICSVLDQPDLALTLGASAVLRKPISQAALLDAVRAALQPADSAG